LADVTSALAQLTAVSGLQFVYDGPSTGIPQSGYGSTQTPDSAPPLLIAWAAPGDGPGRTNLLSDGGEVGTGGWAAMSWRAPMVSGGRCRSCSASSSSKRPPTGARLRPGEWDHARAGVAPRAWSRGGVDHTGDANQVIYPVVDGRAGTYAAGDQAGLAQVGAQAGCIGAGTSPVVSLPPVTPPPIPWPPSGSG